MRFLSHAETVRVFQRACIRAGVEVRYSEGFNPRPRLSLPLPRPVGVESDGDLLCLQVNSDLNEPQDVEYRLLIKAELSSQLPEGIELLSVDIAEPGLSFQAYSAVYVLKPTPECLSDELKVRVERLLADKSLLVSRVLFDSKGAAKELDVRPFLKSIEVDDKDIIVECGISSAGSIRVQEILELLGLDVDKLASPIRRTSIQWNKI